MHCLYRPANKLYKDRTFGVISQPNVPENKTLELDSSKLVRQAAESEVEQNVKFVDPNQETQYDSTGTFDSTRGAADTNVPLDKFWERPVKIFTQQWDVGSTGFYHLINPWEALLKNPRLANRISNYKNFRGNLHVKFTLNGTGFHFGRLLASYTPMFIGDKVTRNSSTVPQDMIAASQRPHIYLDPCNSMGGILRLPFLWYYDSVDLTTSEFTQLGFLNIRELTPLLHANGGTDPVTITAFAWLSDVVISQPTQLDINGLVPQTDEYGVVSGPASVVERISGRLAKAPVIGPYARASEVASGAIKDVAKAFGYCKPIMLDGIKPYRPLYAGNMVNTEGEDSSIKLSLDPKQELSVDPRIVSSTLDDEMSIVKIGERESFLTSFPWKVGDAPETQLFEISVSPMLYDKVSTVENTEYHFTPGAFVAAPFEWWKGSMRIRFQFVTSNYHKGRVRLIYDPNESITSPDYNLAFNQVVDISEENDFSIDIGWASHAGMLRVRGPYSQVDLPFTRTGAHDYSRTSHNGTLKVCILNELTTPNTTVLNDIGVNVFVASCSDMTFMSPRTDVLDKMSIFPNPPPGAAAGIEKQASDDIATSELNEPMQSESNALVIDNPLSSTSDPLLHVYGGESISSIRSLLKRYCYHADHVTIPNGGDWHVMSHINSDFPYYRGYSPTGVDVAGTEPYNRCKMTFLNWFTPAYCCFRGGIRRKKISTSSRFPQGYQSVTRIGDTFANGIISGYSTFASTTDAIKKGLMSTLPSSFAGTHVQPQRMNPVLEYELPQYINRRFMLARDVLIENNNPAANFHRLDELNYSETVGQAAISTYYVAAADDFSLYYFLSVPIFYGIGPLDPS